MKLNQILPAIPVLIALVLSIFLAMGGFSGGLKPEDQHMVGKKIGTFNIPILGEKNKWFSSKNFVGQTVVINFFATWSENSKSEHEALMKLSQARKVYVYGIAWRDRADKVVQLLKTEGNPYQIIAMDSIGSATVPFSMKGIPETYVIGKDGVVRFHTNNPLTEDVVYKVILPLVDQLNSEAIPNQNITNQTSVGPLGIRRAR